MSIFDDIAKALEDAARAVIEGVEDVIIYVKNGVEIAIDTVISGISDGAKACAEVVEGVAFVVVRDVTSAADALKQTAEETWTSIRALAAGKSKPPPPLAMGIRARTPAGDVYLMIDGRLRHIPDRPTYDRLFREWGGFTEIPRADVYPTGDPFDPDAALARDGESGKVYLLVDKTRRWIVGPHVFERYGFSWSTVLSPPADELAGFPEGAPVSGEYIPEGRRVTDPASGKVFVMLDGSLRHIPNPATYDALFRDWKGIGAVGNLAGQRQEAALPADAHLAMAPDGRIFLVADGMKRWIASPAVMDRYQFKWGAVRTVPAEKMDRIPDGSAID